jgi:GST-like protein
MQDIEAFKYVERWLSNMAARPAVQRGIAIGKNLSAHPAMLPPEEL